MKTAYLFLLSALLLGAPPVAAAGSVPLSSGPAWVAERSALVADPSVSDAHFLALARDGDWLERLGAEAVLTWRANPAEARAAWAVPPGRTRVGSLRFTGGASFTEAMAPIALERLVHGDEPTAVRSALVDAVVRAHTAWEEPLLALLAVEPDPEVRVSILYAMKQATPERALAAAHIGLADGDASVRYEAARTVGRLDGGAAEVPTLLRLLSDPAADVRAVSARSLGWLRASTAWQPLVQLLADPDAEVRLQAVHALDRLDRDRLAATAELAPLREDPDTRVRRAVEHVVKP